MNEYVNNCMGHRVNQWVNGGGGGGGGGGGVGWGGLGVVVSESVELGVGEWVSYVPAN